MGGVPHVKHLLEFGGFYLLGLSGHRLIHGVHGSTLGGSLLFPLMGSGVLDLDLREDQNNVN
jgi:hypothetical protein